MLTSTYSILGAGGRLGAAVARHLNRQGKADAWSRQEFDICRSENFSRLRSPWVINCAAATSVDWCETHPEEAQRVNATAPGNLARHCARENRRLIHISTDYVFDGLSRAPYVENFPVSPLGVYGRTKADGERQVLQASSEHLIIRVSWVFGPDRASFVDQILERARHGQHLEAIADKISCPTYSEDFADWLDRLLASNPPGGIYQLCNAGNCSWQEYGQAVIDIAAELGLLPATRPVHPLRLEEMTSFLAPRPPYTAMDCFRAKSVAGLTIRPWQEALRAYLQTKTL